jgi:hypothetical protein
VPRFRLLAVSRSVAVELRPVEKFGEFGKFFAPKSVFTVDVVALTGPPTPNGAFSVYVMIAYSFENQNRGAVPG